MYRKHRLDDIYFGPNKKSKTEKPETIVDNLNLNIKNNLLSDLEKKNDVKIERDNNHIYFYSEVDRESVFDLLALIREAEEESLLTSFKLNIPEIPIYLHINSLGGAIYEALNVVDTILSSKIPIYTIIEGATASAGTLISIVGKKRFIRPNAHMLIHQLSAGCWGKMEEIDDQYQNYGNLMIRVKKMYQKYCDIPKKELDNILKHDLWFDSDKCLKYKLVDELW